MRNARFDDRDADRLHPCPDLLQQRFNDRVATVAQRHHGHRHRPAVRPLRFARRPFALPDRVLGLDLVIGVHARHPSQRGFALGFDIVCVGADLQERLCGVLHAPDDHRANIDRVAGRIVDLEWAGLQRFEPARNLGLRVERVDPPKPRPVFSADIASEQQAD